MYTNLSHPVQFFFVSPHPTVTHALKHIAPIRAGKERQSAAETANFPAATAAPNPARHVASGSGKNAAAIIIGVVALLRYIIICIAEFDGMMCLFRVTRTISICHFE